MIGKLSSVVAPPKFNKSITQVTQHIDDFMDSRKLLELISKHKSKIIAWFNNEGLEITVEALSESRCALLAGYVHACLPLPVRIIVKEELIAGLLWKNVSQIVSVLKG